MAEVTSLKRHREKKRRQEKRRNRGIFHFDYSLMIAVLILLSFGVIMVYSSSAYSSSLDGNSESYLIKHALNILVAFVLFFLAFFIDYHKTRKFAMPMFLLGALSLVMLIPLGHGSHGATRWINLGFMNFQPAELMKTAVIVAMAVMIVVAGPEIATKKKVITLFTIGGIVPAALIYFLSDNLSSAGITLLISFFMLFISVPRKKWFFVAMGVVGVIFLIIVIYASTQTPETVSWRLARIVGWLHPEEYASDQTYQTLQGLYAIGSGGFFGKGLGKSLQKLSSIPEAQNDMIFAVICEELGIFGAILLIGIFLFLLWRIYNVAMKATDKYGMMLCMGVFFHIAIQFILNMAVVTNLFPNTGVTLPFISYGGSALMFTMLEMGIVLNVSSKIPLEEQVA